MQSAFTFVISPLRQSAAVTTPRLSQNLSLLKIVHCTIKFAFPRTLLHLNRVAKRGGYYTAMPSDSLLPSNVASDSKEEKPGSS